MTSPFDSKRSKSQATRVEKRCVVIVLDLGMVRQRCTALSGYVFPRKIPDVFKGEQVIVYGRYTGHGEKTIKLTGNVGGKTQTFEYRLDFPEYSEDDKHAFVPRLWAGKKVDFLLNELRKQEKPSEELVDEVTYLAKRYGIITPYTSYLMDDDIATRPSAGTPFPGGGGLIPLLARSSVRPPSSWYSAVSSSSLP